MPSREHLDVKTVQIIRIEGSKFMFDVDKLQSIVDKNEHAKNLPVAVIIINGALRTGKSFFSNFIIRHLYELENPKSSSANKLKDYFKSRRGADIQTLGVWMFDHIFVHNGNAIILMDTQGIFDQELNQAMTVALITLSTIVSSYQIYNLDKRIQEDHLCNMAYFSAYSSLISNTSNTKIGQTLCLLVRDWQNFENGYDLERCDTEADMYKKSLLDDLSIIDETKRETRKKIYNTYDDVVVRLCPHPGHLVTEGKFSGMLSDIRDDFKIHVDHIITRILNDLRPKRIGSNQILLCREFPNYVKEYVTLYDNVKASLPEAMTILETTEKICQENAKTKTIHHYRERMMSRIRETRMTRDDISAWHKSCLRDAQRYFNKLYVMGRDEDIVQIRKDILLLIENEYQQFLMMSREKNILYMALDAVKDFIMYLDINFDLLSELFIKNAFMILALSYIFTSFIPFGGEFIATIISYIICILSGIYICVYLKGRKDELERIKIEHDTTNTTITFPNKERERENKDDM